MYDYKCPDCNEAKLQSDKNARKINEVIDQVNALIQVNNETVDFIEEKANEVVGEVAEIKVNEVLGDLRTEVDDNTKKIYKTCSEIGMTLNDENNNNHILMSEFINLGYSLKVDDFYNVNIINSIEINNNIEFISESNKHGFNFISNVNNTCWKIINGCSKIIAENLTIKGSKVILFSHPNMSHFMDLIKFNNNKVSGDFVLLNLRCETELTDNCKINKIVINNNHLEIKYIDIFDDENYYVRGFVKVTNIPFDSIDIHYNTLINMERTFGYFSVDDTNSYRENYGSTDYLTNARKFINVRNNYVKNSDDCICPFEYASLRYCCFILAECFELVYKNNYVEGLKSDKE